MTYQQQYMFKTIIDGEKSLNFKLCPWENARVFPVEGWSPSVRHTHELYAGRKLFSARNYGESGTYQSMWNLGTCTSWFCQTQMNVHFNWVDKKSTGICTKISHTLVCTTFPKVSGRKQFFYQHIILEYVATKGF